MNDVEKRKVVRLFTDKWNGKGKEDEDDRSYWIDILSKLLEVPDVTDHIDFQKKVIVDGHTKRIDAYIPETKVLIEQKSLGIPLDKKLNQSGGIELTPYEQAKRYNDNLPYEEKARWIVTSNFAEIWIYDMNARIPKPVKLEITNLQSQYSVLGFLIKENTNTVNIEMELSLIAGELVGKLYDAFLEQYMNKDSEETLKSLNKLCVRIVFCLYAEDAGIFGKKNMFHDYMKQFSASSARKGLIELFKVLDQKPEDRDPYLSEDDPLLASFPYVNGGLFADEDIEIPSLTDEILQILLSNASDDFDWSGISPTIFGATFESTLNPETRRSGGMHYTSIENIHKVIDPLFLNDLNDEFIEICKVAVTKTKNKKLKAFQNKLASLSFLDPACGSGNFLTETYLSLRRLENETLKLLLGDQIRLGIEGIDKGDYIKVSIKQFYGIEINDFAVTVAKTALWIAESQTMKETEDIVHMPLDFLPLKTYANIVEGNALCIDWEDVVPKHELNYIMGNPPFVGAMWSKGEQRKDIENVFPECRKTGQIDYVAGWYAKATKLIMNTSIRCAFVSTNSICQGQQVGLIWEPLMNICQIKIDFAYTTFRWDSEANLKAHVHCIIVGFSHISVKTEKRIYSGERYVVSNHINGYLMPTNDVFIMGNSQQISGMPLMHMGVMARDGGYLIMDEKEYQDYIKVEPQGLQFIRPYMMGREFINNIPRYCFWLKGANPSLLKKCPLLLERIENVKKTRLNSKAVETQKLADCPTLFAQLNQPTGDFIAFPKVSSEKRRYIPIGFLNENTIVGDKLYVVENVEIFHFGVLTSNVHNSWMRTVCGRLKSDYSYSNTIVYNSFPWPNLTKEQKEKIEKTAQAILDARTLYQNSSLADLYDELAMPTELRKAHQENDRAVMQAYGFDVKTMTEADCVAELMKMYQKLTKE